MTVTPETLAKLNPAVFERAAEHVSQHVVCCCWAIRHEARRGQHILTTVRDMSEDYATYFGALFKPHDTLYCGPWWPIGLDQRFTRAFALDLCALQLRDDQARLKAIRHLLPVKRTYSRQ